METPMKGFKTPVKKKKIPATPQTPTVDSTVRRRVSDILVTLHKCIQTWETDNAASFNTANTLCNLYSQWGNVKDNNNVPEINDTCKRKYYVKLVSIREDLLAKLIEHLDKLKALITRITSLGNNLKAIHYLGLVSDNATVDVSNLNESIVAEPAIFNSWTANQFYHNTRLILNMYSKEYLLKCSLFKRFFHFRVENEEVKEEETRALNQCINMWLHQPYIEEQSKFLLDSMLIEAELK